MDRTAEPIWWAQNRGGGVYPLLGMGFIAYIPKNIHKYVSVYILQSKLQANILQSFI